MANDEKKGRGTVGAGGARPAASKGVAKTGATSGAAKAGGAK